MQNSKDPEVLSPQFDNKNARNLNAITLYVYQKGFIVKLCLWSSHKFKFSLNQRDQQEYKRDLSLIGLQEGYQREVGFFWQDFIAKWFFILDLDSPVPDGFERKAAYSAYLGNITVQNKVFLLLCNEAIPICKIDKKHPIFTVATLSFWPYQVYNPQ